MSYKVFVDDNFHYMDEEHRYFLGEFDTAEAAVVACQKVVNEVLEEFYKPGMTAAELGTLYSFFGEDPFMQTAFRQSPGTQYQIRICSQSRVPHPALSRD
jgi:hypothetical protein